MNITRYCNSKHKDWAIYVSGEKLKYMLRDEAILKHSRKSFKTNLTDYLFKTRLDNPENSGLIKFDFENKSVSYPKLENTIETFKKLNKKQFVWDGEISISKEDANRLNFGTQKDYIELIQRYMPSFLKVEGLDPNIIDFYGAVHANTKNPHLHFIFFEKEKSIYDEKTKEFVFKKKGKLKLDNIQKFEKLSWDFINQKDKENEIFSLKKDFWTNKNELKNELKQMKFERLNSYAWEIINEVNVSNVKNYKNLSPESKKLIQIYFEAQLEEMDVGIQERYENHINFLKKYPDDEHFQKEQASFENWIGNKVLRDLKETYISKNNDHSNHEQQPEKMFRTNFRKIKFYLNEYDYKQKQNYLKRFKQIQWEIAKEKRNISNSS